MRVAMWKVALSGGVVALAVGLWRLPGLSDGQRWLWTGGGLVVLGAVAWLVGEEG